MDDPGRCMRCDGELEAGFLVDKGAYNAEMPTEWASGKASWSAWRGTSIGRDARQCTIVTYRCTRCGRLESYAHEKKP